MKNRLRLLKAYASAIFVMLLISSSVNAQQFLTKIDGWNAYVHLPDDYNDSVTKKYPLICFIPGLGEIGTNASKLLTYGPAKFINSGSNMQFWVNGKLEKPIVISMQPVNGWPNAYTINVKLDSILKRWRIDPLRVNATGLSMGGWSWNNYVDGYSSVYTNKIASIVSMSAPEPDNQITNMRHFALAGGKWWGFEGNTDLRKGDRIRDTLNKYVPASARYTLYIGGHCCWNDYYNPNYKENGESIYTWMLKQKRTPPLPILNNDPEANAGNDLVIAQSISTITLAGEGNDPDGNTIKFSWRKLEGPAGNITNITNPQTNVISLTTGTYKFELEVTDVLGGKGKDTVTIHNGNIVLPIRLTSFVANARNGEANLQWKTSSEINSSHFEIERSVNAIQFTKIGEVAGAVNSNGEQRYAFTDNDPSAERVFYRLKMVDKDGTFAYSNTVNLLFSEITSAAVDIYQAGYHSGNLNLGIRSPKDQRSILIVSDVSGRRIYQGKIDLQSGITSTSINIPSMRGTYYVTLSDGIERMTRAVIHQ